jgi:hypothetical protein
LFDTSANLSLSDTEIFEQRVSFSVLDCPVWGFDERCRDSGVVSPCPADVVWNARSSSNVAVRDSCVAANQLGAAELCSTNAGHK